MRGQALLAISALSAALLMAEPASAQNYRSYHDEHVDRAQQCSTARSNSQVGGAIIGGLLGAVVGSHVSANRHRSDGAIVGGVLGAATGAAIGQSNADRRCATGVQGQYDPYYGQPQGQQGYGQQDYYQQDQRYRDDRLAGGPYDRSAYNDDRRYDRRQRRDDCRWGQILTRDPDGYEIRENVWMCRGRDGEWRPMQQ